MSNIAKVILPLVDNSISLDDISEKTGFIAMYTEDINRPYLDDHIFLMYNWSDKKSAKVFYKFRELPSFYGYKIIYLKGVPHIVYTFTSNSLINRLKKGTAILRDINKLRVLQFWQFKDAWVSLNVTRGTVAGDPLQDVLPEEDYMPE
jgi:hypothetical protein